MAFNTKTDEDETVVDPDKTPAEDVKKIDISDKHKILEPERRRVPSWAWLAGGGLIGLVIMIMTVFALVSNGREGEGSVHSATRWEGSPDFVFPGLGFRCAISSAP